MDFELAALQFSIPAYQGAAEIEPAVNPFVECAADDQNAVLFR